MRKLLGLLASGQSTPASFPGCAVWLDAQDMASFTFNGPDVSGWLNKGNVSVGNAAQGTASLQPLYVASGINGKPAVQFYDDSTGKQMEIADHVGLNFTSFSYFSVIRRMTDLGTTESILSKWNPTGNQREFQNLVNGSNDLAVTFSSPDGTSSGLSTAQTGSTIATGTPYILSGYWSGAETGVAINNGTAGTAITAAIFNGTGNIQIGSLGVSATSPFAGYIGEIIFYNQQLTAADRSSILGYLSAKWQIAF